MTTGGKEPTMESQGKMARKILQSRSGFSYMKEYQAISDVLRIQKSGKEKHLGVLVTLRSDD